MAETIDHQGGTTLASNEGARRQEALLRVQLIDEVREELLNEGPRSEGIVPSEQVKALFHGIAEAAVATLFKRLRVISIPSRVFPKDCEPGETTQQTIDRLIKPALSARLGDAMLSSGLVGVGLAAPLGGAYADFESISFAIDARPQAGKPAGQAPTSFLLGGGPVNVRGAGR